MGDRLLTPGEVARVFRVDPKTVTRWAAGGRLGSIRTPGGHRRFRASEVRALLEEGCADDPAVDPDPLPALLAGVAGSVRGDREVPGVPRPQRPVDDSSPHRS